MLLELPSPRALSLPLRAPRTQDETWHAVVHGRKHWLLRTPQGPAPRTKMLRVPAATVLEAEAAAATKIRGLPPVLQHVQRPGEVLYLPAGWCDSTQRLTPLRLLRCIRSSLRRAARVLARPRAERRSGRRWHATYNLGRGEGEEDGADGWEHSGLTLGVGGATPCPPPPAPSSRTERSEPVSEFRRHWGAP